MEEATEQNPPTGQQNLILSKILLLKYNLLHEFHVKQLEMYIIACCNISIDGLVRISALDHVVSYEIKTTKVYKKTGKETIKKSKFSLFPYITKKKYNSEILMAKENLTKWTKELLWGEGTFIKVTVDGKEID